MPPSTNLVSRTLNKDTKIAGMMFPKGTQATLDVYELHHNPRVWSDPERFNPDRFLPGGEAEKLSSEGATMAWVPFGNGARQ